MIRVDTDHESMSLLPGGMNAWALMALVPPRALPWFRRQIRPLRFV